MCLKIAVIGENSVERQFILGASDSANKALCKSIRRGLENERIGIISEEGGLFLTLGGQVILHSRELAQKQLTDLEKLLSGDSLEMLPWQEMDGGGEYFVGFKILKSTR